MKSEESMAGEDSKLEGTCSGNTFYNQKNKTPMKIPEFKRSRIGIIVEFCRIPSGFPNQGRNHEALSKQTTLQQ
jgi:hypothetical protein